MQRHRTGIISNFFAEPVGQSAGVGADQKVVNFEQILFANGRMLHLIEAMCSSKSSGNLTAISVETDHEKAQCACDCRWRRVIGGGALLVSVVA
jgi:hypothetical protein